MRTLLLFSTVALLGCGGGSLGSATVNGLTLHIQDSLYKTIPTGRFCQGFATDQVELFFDDYKHDCYLDQKVGEMPRDPTLDHLQLELVLSFGGNETATNPPFSPFTFDSSADCDTGGADSIANFLHYAPNSTTPSETFKADHGSITITRYDRTNKVSMTGSYDLFFGGSEVKGTIDTLNCD
jgi:hypothetical protein